ncbi:MAG: DUF3823 domain-containing protein [Ginsengibacter sp.]
MKNLLRYILIPVIALSFFSCKKDNYSEHGTFLTGSLMYNGDSVQVERNQVLFDGDYKLIIPNGQGPFLWKQTSSGAPDSLAITLKGNQSVNLGVIPYYMVRNTQISAADSNVNATFKADKIVTDPGMAKDIERLSLYINKI